MNNKERLRHQITELQKRWDLLGEKLLRLEKEKIYESNIQVKFQIEHLIDETSAERRQVEQRLSDLETQLRRIENAGEYTDNRNEQSLPEERGLRALLEHMQQDLIARESELLEKSSIPSKQWFVQEVSRCNVGERYYINRWVNVDGMPKRLVEEVKDWVEHDSQPYLFVVGSSGIGKTNFLIAEVIAPIVEENITLIKNSQPLNQAIVFFRLGSYNPELTLWSNFEELVNNRIQPSERLSKEIFRKLVLNGTIILILDGLDEFMRVHGEDFHGVIVGALQENIAGLTQIMHIKS